MPGTVGLLRGPWAGLPHTGFGNQCPHSGMPSPASQGARPWSSLVAQGTDGNWATRCEEGNSSQGRQAFPPGQ